MSPVLKSIGLMAIGAVVYHIVQKKYGVKKTHRLTNDHLEEIQKDVHVLIDGIYNGKASEEEISAAVLEVVK